MNGGGIIQEIPNKGRLRGRALVAVLYHVICARPVFPETDEADNDDEGTSQDPVMTQDNDSAPFTQADGQAKTLRGLDGDDTYFISNLLPENSSITIIDTSGTNTIRL